MAVSAGAGRPNHQHDCPTCSEEAEPVAPILLLGLGGMLAFFSFGFWIVAFVAEPGMLMLALGMTVVGLAMMGYGWHIISKNKKRKMDRHEASLVKAKCEYCGGQNRPEDKKCQFCGAPLF